MLETMDVKLTKVGLNIEDMKKRLRLEDMPYYIIFDNIFGLSFRCSNEKDKKILNLLGELAGMEWKYESLQNSQPEDKEFRLIVRADLEKINFNQTEIEIVAIGCRQIKDKKSTNESEEFQFLGITTGKLYDSEDEVMDYLG